ncbi:hypothetical protein SETIT_4G169600v2 [Setaria italica]|uniref:Secreted protein n=2 Tax=Setaria TaxID=4554 RepID=A0A368QV93_SETIT|nr:hypothetical protein SETIT_4G169600v2 [Setaria italica]TKW21701.1 hypothetical protein SEVIR_4G137603v2 [Setaria viridis]
MNLVRLLFLLLAAVVGGAVEWICWGFRGLGCPPSSSSFSEFWLLVSFSGLLELRLRVPGRVKASGSPESTSPTADVWLPSMCCSFPLFGVRSSIWTGAGGGLELWATAWGSDGSPQLDLRRKKSSRVLFVIFWFLRVRCVREGCTVLSFIF